MFSVMAKPNALSEAYTIPSMTPSNSSFFQKKKIKRMNALPVSSTMGAEITAANASPAFGLVKTAMMSPLTVLKRNAKKGAKKAPQQKAGASIQRGSAS